MPSLHGQEDASLAKYRWENRLLLFFPSDHCDPTLTEALAPFLAEPEQLTDRKLKLLIVCPAVTDDPTEGVTYIAGVAAEKLRKRYALRQEGTTVVLIGLDGGKKFAGSAGTELPQEIFSRIDQMPMRRAELRNKRGGNRP